MKLRSAVAIVVFCCATHAHAQGVAITPKIGTLGYGADLTVGLGERTNLRIGYATGEYEPEIRETDIDYDGKIELGNGNVFLDLHPGGRGFRFSIGAIINNSDVTARSTEETTIVVNNRPYRVSDVGTLVGTIEFDEIAPYLGIGFGNAVRGGRVSFSFDLGAAWVGEPKVSLVAIPNDPSTPFPPGFESDLRAEEEELQEAVSDYRILPLVQFGVSFRF
jgi:hypothetical protein